MRPTISLQKKLIFFIISILSLVILITIFIIYPAVKQILTLQKSVANTESYLEEQYTKTQYMRRSIRELDQITQSVKKFKNAGIRKGDELTLITQLEQLAEINHLNQNLDIAEGKIKNDKPEEEKQPNNQTTKPFYSLTFVNSGTFFDHYNFFKSLEELPYYLIIKSIQFEKPAKNTTTSTPVIARFNATIYEISP